MRALALIDKEKWEGIDRCIEEVNHRLNCVQWPVNNWAKIVAEGAGITRDTLYGSRLRQQADNAIALDEQGMINGSAVDSLRTRRLEQEQEQKDRWIKEVSVSPRNGLGITTATF